MNYFNENAKAITMTERKKKSAAVLKEYTNKGLQLNPITPKGKIKISDSFWGKSWCRNIEQFEDLDYRLARGRSCLRSDSIIDLKIQGSQVKAKVLGLEMYNVVINFMILSEEKWNRFAKHHSASIPSLIDLLTGAISEELANAVICPEYGLFPLAEEISFDCNCLDYADCCEHVAATLYGIGIYFDRDPKLFFQLRGRDPQDLLQIDDSKLITDAAEIEHQTDLEEIFDIEITISE